MGEVGTSGSDNAPSLSACKLGAARILGLLVGVSEDEGTILSEAVGELECLGMWLQRSPNKGAGPCREKPLPVCGTGNS